MYPLVFTYMDPRGFRCKHESMSEVRSPIMSTLLCKGWTVNICKLIAKITLKQTKLLKDKKQI